MDQRTCECGTVFQTAHPTKRFCTEHCRKRAETRRWFTKHRATGRPAGAPRIRICATEGCARYPTRGRSKAYCADCYNARQISRPTPKEPRRTWYAGDCIQCGDAFVFNQPANRTCSPACANRYHRHIRKLRKRAVYIEEVWRPKVYERDGWTCQLCRKPVDRTKVAPHPRAPTIDHIIPIAKGGEHSYANTQLACFMCNCTKSDGMPLDAQLRLAA